MKLILQLLLMFMIVGRAMAGCAGGSPTWASTPDYTSVASCVSQASADDTINVSAGDGTETWTSTLNITKAIHIIGPGESNLTISKTTSGYLMSFQPSPQSSNPEIEVSGFAFSIGNSAGGIELWYYNSQITSQMNKANIHECTFTGKTSPSGLGTEYIISAGMGGVVWKCTFSGAWQYFRGMQEGTESYLTVYDTALGTANALYFEDNVFNKVGNADEYIYDCQYGGMRVVWRYNTFNIPDTSSINVIDWHEYNSSDYAACVGHLMYGNDIVFTNNGSTYAIAAARGGRSILLFNNLDTTTDSNSIGWASGEYGCPTNYLDYQEVQTYSVSNLRNLTTNDLDGWDAQSGISCVGIEDYPAVDWSLFDYESSFDGSTGAGCGTSGSRPATCSERVGYWQTTQDNCADITGYVGDIVNNPTRSDISGTMYVCGDSNDWAEWWTPYTYPHPLRGEGEGEEVTKRLKLRGN